MICCSSLEDIHEDDDIVVRSETITQLDPLTKQPIKEGVRNKKCGHIYERVPIISVLKKKKEIRYVLFSFYVDMYVIFISFHHLFLKEDRTIKIK